MVEVTDEGGDVAEMKQSPHVLTVGQHEGKMGKIWRRVRVASCRNV